MTQIDLFDSTISLAGPNSIAAEQVNNGVDAITLRFFQLPDDGSEDGLYVIAVDPGDILGNHPTEPYTFNFVYDTTSPKIASTIPDNREMVTITMERVEVVLTDGEDESAAGIDLDNCSMKLIGPDGETVAGKMTREGEDTLIFTLATSDDGPEDGSYTINVMTQDLAGNSGGPILVNFTHITKSPAVSSTTPADADVFNTPISSVSAALVDNSDAGLDLENSALTLIGTDGEIVPGTHGFSEPNIVTYALDHALATDGKADGVYALDILVADATGETASYRSSFIFDTIPPAVIATSPDHGDMTKEAMEHISVQIEDAGSGVDLAGSEVALIGPDGGVAGTQVNDGVNAIEYRFSPLDDGRYTISVNPVDNAGNVPSEPQNFSFIRDATAPVVKETEPADGAVVVVALDKISIQMDDANGAGPAPETSSMALIAPDGSQIPGVRNDSGSAMTLTFPALAIDGGDNGQYTVTATLQDQIGNRSEEYRFAFTYLPTAPGVISMSPAAGSFVGIPVKKVALILEDKSGSGIDFRSSWIKLLAPDGREVPGQMANDGASGLSLDLQNQFSTNGDDDGEYTVEINVADNEGNSALLTRKFAYDTAPAVVLRAYLGDAENGVTMDNCAVVPSDFGIVNRVSAALDDAGIGVDLSMSSIFVFNPSGSEIVGERQNN